MISASERRRLSCTMRGRFQLAELERVEHDPVLSALMPTADRLQMMATPAGRQRLAEMDGAALDAAGPAEDPWVALTAGLHGRVHAGEGRASGGATTRRRAAAGVEVIPTREVFDLLRVPLHLRNVATGCRLAEVMARHRWEQCRIPDSLAGGKRCRGYRRVVPLSLTSEKAVEMPAGVADAAHRMLAAWRRDDPGCTRTIEDAYVALSIPLD
jgi:hypothetical protein